MMIRADYFAMLRENLQSFAGDQVDDILASQYPKPPGPAVLELQARGIAVKVLPVRQYDADTLDLLGEVLEAHGVVLPVADLPKPETQTEPETEKEPEDARTKDPSH